jgi:hypothetical protein
LTVGIPTNAAVTGTRIGIVVVVLAAFVFDAVIDHAFGVPPRSLAEVPFGTITLSAGFIIQAPTKQLLVLLDGGVVVADAGRIFVHGRFIDVAEPELVAFRSAAAIALFLAFVVPRDAAFVISVRVRHTGGVILVLQFANESIRAFSILHAQFLFVMR